MAVNLADAVEAARAGRATGSGSSRGMSRARRAEEIQGWLMISPWILGFLAFTAYPMLASFYYSFTSFKIIGSPNWTGLYNYIYAFSGKPFGSGDPLFWLSLGRTVIWVVATVPLGVLGSLLAAVLLNQHLKGTAFLRAAFFLPYLTPVVAASILWMWMLQPDIGIFNTVIHETTGLYGPKWLAMIEWALPSLAMISLWTAIGGNRMLIFLAGLQSIPAEMYEAAKCDGANPVQQWWHITVPLVSPAIFFNLIIGIIASFRVFDMAFVTTLGGPAYSTYFYALHLYTQAFSSFDMGYGCTLAWILFIIVLIITLIQLKFANRWVYYESVR
jgi:multiple sugar transport system permease protein